MKCNFEISILKSKSCDENIRFADPSRTKNHNNMKMTFDSHNNVWCHCDIIVIFCSAWSDF